MTRTKHEHTFVSIVFPLKINSLEEARQWLRRSDRLTEEALGVVSAGAPGIDGALPWNGLPRARLHEIDAAAGDGAPAGFAATLVARLTGSDGLALWCRPSSGAEAGAPYGPALARFGVAPDRLLFVAARRAPDVLWAMEEGLRARRFAVVIGEAGAPDLTATRRLQLAAEAGGSTALLLVTPRAGRLSAAVTRWQVNPRPAERPEVASWQLALMRCRGGGRGTWHVEWSHEALHLRVLAALADRPVALAAE